MKIAFIGFGEAAQSFRASLAAADPNLRFTAYDILLRNQGYDGACARGMRAGGVDVARNPAEAISGADWIFSAVTADQSLEAIRSVTGHISAGQYLFDINSVSPGCKRQSAGMLERTGAVYIDMAVMAPVHPKGHCTPVLLAGALETTLARLTELGFDFKVTGPEPGAATAIKMVRSLFVKGLEAITVETLLAASAFGCLDYVLNSLDRSYPGLRIPDLARYQLERTLKHGKRRAAEMRESAVTLSELGLHGELASAIAAVQAEMGAIGLDVESGDLDAVLARLVLSRRA